MPRVPPDDPEASLNLKQAATKLGVHYMTAYRYVRQGRLPAERDGTAWRVLERDIASFLADDVPVVAGDRTDWAARLVTPLLAGDEATAWALIERALASGHDAAFCSIDVIGAAVALIDQQRAAGSLDAARQPLATAVAYRLISRLGARFRRPGRSRGCVVFGAPSGERHVLPIAIVADVLRFAGFDVLELGADTPPEAFAAAASAATRLVAVGLGITSIEHVDEARRTIAAIRAAMPSVPVIVGGQAVLNPQTAAVLDADLWAEDARSAVTAIESLVPARS